MTSQAAGENTGQPNARQRRALLWLVAALLGCWTLWSTAILPRLEPVSGVQHALQSIVVRVGFWVVPSGVYLWTQHGRAALHPLRLGLPPSATHWVYAIGIAVLASLAVSLDVASKLDVAPVVVWTMLPESLVSGFPAGELFEELVFRGVVFSELLSVLGVADFDHGIDARRRLRVWLANLTASAVFVGLHWPWWIYTHGIGTEFWTKTAGVFLISLVLGMVFAGGRSLWPCVGLHWVNNALSSLAP